MAKDLQKMSHEELTQELVETREKIRVFTMAHSSGPNTKERSALRKHVARILTTLQTQGRNQQS
ncbi:MAG: 50S ribosomal protein L29 [Candidatus Pacebacteria bacterium]|nr:50S ribosomal protein L29 [Candidatus Paceibacterota bacterium]MCD8508080.1 50S ribosomal protein L29 [Candidatus Paceibacterota bacterium]MCD8528214.1 50S ribosomal protein L29 [Candidatus Paceibacterota bacterium]MCD8563853.1 50S ribosomal protein L29 [Candidatus Paceibacterota bacterium]